MELEIINIQVELKIVNSFKNSIMNPFLFTIFKQINYLK